MGFLGSIGSFISGAAKTVAKTITSPAKLTTAIATGGASVIAPRTFAPVTSAVGSTLFNPSLIGTAASLALPGVGGRVASLVPTGGNMGFNLGSLIPGAISGLGSLLGGASPSQALSSFTSFLPPLSPPGGIPQNPMAMPTAAGAQALARAGAVVGRSFFNKYPNLAAVIQAWRNRGLNITRAKLWTLMKRFGPEILVSGGILTAAAVSELMVAGPGRRRMNPANGRALRRSLRRLESFERLCHRVDRSLHSRRGGRRSRANGSRSTTLIRQG